MVIYLQGNMKQHMMTHKLRDMPQHMFGGSNSIDSVSQTRSPEPQKETHSSLRVKSEAELSPSSTENSRGSDRRERSLPPPFHSPTAENNYHLMFERQLQQQQMHHNMQQPLALSQSRRSQSPSTPHIKPERRQKPDIDEPNPKRQLCKSHFFLLLFFHSSFIALSISFSISISIH